MARPQEKPIAEKLPVSEKTAAVRELADIFRQGLRLDEPTRTRLQSEINSGVEFFEHWNESRIKLAFESFDTSMKYALFEIIYLLNTNNPKYQHWTYQIFSKSDGGNPQGRITETDLYVEGAPCGVKGVCDLSVVFRAEFDEYMSATFDAPILLPGNGMEPAIEGIYSIGSSGTVGHKKIDSVLDLQVQYYLQPYPSDVSNWHDRLFLESLRKEQNLLLRQISESQDAVAIRTKALGIVQRQLKGKYPLLFQHFFLKSQKPLVEIIRKKNQKVREQLFQEIISLMKFSGEATGNIEIERQGALLKQRISKIQGYINNKFPEVEINLFSFSRQELQQGYLGSSLESNESARRADELSLNYEALQPGLFFTPVIPSHFLFSPETNNDRELFNQFNDIVRFRLMPALESCPQDINFQGPTPDLDAMHVAQHSAAAYREVFKGSSANLPMATLNLLRFEMMLEPRFSKTIIQLVKQPDLLDEYIPSTASLSPDKTRAEALYPLCDLFFPIQQQIDPSTPDTSFTFAADQLMKFEEKYPDLKLDPWWLGYKSVKIGFGGAGLVSGVLEDQLIGISNILDLCFALQISVTDVFTSPGDQRKFSGYRETVLLDFLATAFPEGSWQRNKLESIFIGDIKTVNKFEKQLQTIFQNSVGRIHFKVSGLDLAEEKQTSKEEEIWYHYYKKGFDAAPNIIQKSILNHLQVPRSRLQIGFKKDTGWVFRSLQKKGSRGNRFTSSILDLLPDEVVLTVQQHFLNGLVHCVINGYYGIFNRGRLDETKTIIEFDRKNMRLESQLYESRAFVRPDQIERIMKQMLDMFPERKVSPLDCIQEESSISEMIVFLNLLEYGLLSILSRDNRNTFYVDHLKIPGFCENASSHIGSYKAMLATPELHALLQQFVIKKNINICAIKMATWVNSNSVATNHATTQHEAKEQMLSGSFRELILKVLRQPDSYPDET